MFWDWKANYAYFFTLRMYELAMLLNLMNTYMYFDDYGEIAETGYSAD